jgi:hypothetical protein
MANREIFFRITEEPKREDSKEAEIQEDFKVEAKSETEEVV